MSYKGKKNQYTCPTCDHKIVTIDADEGTTPMTIRCPKYGCSGIMRSGFYEVDQSLEPTHEWYAPKAKAMKNKNRKYRDYVLKGGLFMRPIKGKSQ